MKVETDDLIDSHGVAGLVGICGRGAVAVYRKRYGDFPTPVVDMGAGRCLLWLRSDVERWAAARSGGSHG